MKIINMRPPKVMIAAIIWLEVSDEANIPTAVKKAPASDSIVKDPITSAVVTGGMLPVASANIFKCASRGNQSMR